MPVLEAVGTAVPEHRVDQTFLRDVAVDVLREHVPDLAPLVDLFDNTRIRSRHFAKPLDWYMQDQGWVERSRAFVDVGLPLAQRAAQEAMDEAGVAAQDVDGVVFVSTTGIATPSLDARLVNALGLRPDVMRVPVWGLGCGGGVAGLTRARDLTLAHGDKRVLLVALELCSLQFLFDRLNKKNLVAASLFSDGCAAALVSGDALAIAEGRDHAPALAAGASHLFPHSENVMGWDVAPHGLDVVFSRRIPDIVQQEMGALVNGFLKQHAEGALPHRWLFHPGGARVIDAYVTSLGVPDGAFTDTARVLREYGNMSSPTVLFVLQQALRNGALDEGERALLAALGPGFAAELHLLEGR